MPVARQEELTTTNWWDCGTMQCGVLERSSNGCGLGSRACSGAGGVMGPEVITSTPSACHILDVTDLNRAPRRDRREALFREQKMEECSLFKE